MKSLTLLVKQSALALFGLGVLTAPAHAINITTNSDGNQLVNNILGSGITVSNVKYNGAAGASGTFTGGLSSGIGIDKGIILTTGSASLAAGPNNQTGATKDNGLGGDANLNALVPNFSTFDATSLEFDFVSDSSDVFFNFVFGSEEYPEFVGTSFNDVFGFFLDGVNIAQIPGTQTAVSINNVNANSNSQFFVNNTTGAFNLQYDGFTKVLTAKGQGLKAGKHTIKLAIADAGDRVLDSAVFIQAGTFSSVPTAAVPEPASLLGLAAFGAFGVTSLHKRKQQAKA